MNEEKADACKNVRDALALDANDTIALGHIESCEACRKLQSQLLALDSGLHQLPEQDVSNEVVAELLARPELKQSPSASTRTLWPLSRKAMALGSSFAAAAAMLLVFLVMPMYRSELGREADTYYGQPRRSEASDDEQFVLEAGPVGTGSGGGVAMPEAEPPSPPRAPALGGRLDADKERDLRAQQSLDGIASLDDSNAPAAERVEGEVFALGDVVAPEEKAKRQIAPVEAPAAYAFDAPRDALEEQLPTLQKQFENNAPAKDDAGKKSSELRRNEALLAETEEEMKLEQDAVYDLPAKRPVWRKRLHVEPDYPNEARDRGVEGTVQLSIDIDSRGNVTDIQVVKSIPLLDGAAIEAVRQWKYEPSNVMRHQVIVDVEFTLDAPNHDGLDAARRFFEERGNLDNLSFKSARGYWANTYVPGSPALRHLSLRLERASTELFGLSGGRLPLLHRAAHRIAQPFDAPTTNALAVYLHADRASLSERGRMLVQVGLQANASHARRRPPMNVGVVLDLRGELAPETVSHARAMLSALNESKELGDRFRLIVAGAGGGEVVAPESFRLGALMVALDELTGSTTGAELELVPSVELALEAVHAGDDPTMPLGTSLVVIATPRTLDRETASLRKLAHASAVGGVPVSVIGLGSSSNADHLDPIALAGQGRRHFIETAADATKVVEAELSATSRVVARAIRLRIKLAEGVQLVDVLGSRSLSERQAEQVREAEKSVDLRLSRNLGIEADRGDDEDGIQFVIPSFYATDHHTILLDVVASGPGPIAEVTARYKDLATLSNTVAKASLALGDRRISESPLETNVLKNYLVFRLSQNLETAGRCLDSGRVGEALQTLVATRDLLRGLRHELASLSRDREIAADVAMLNEYLTLLSQGAASSAPMRAYLADSLRVAGALKRFPVPALS